MDEIKRRNEISDDDWEHIEAGQIYVGMPEIAMVCSWGSYRRVNTTEIGNTLQRQCSFDRGDVYVLNGRVTAIYYY